MDIKAISFFRDRFIGYFLNILLLNNSFLFLADYCSC